MKVKLKMRVLMVALAVCAGARAAAAAGPTVAVLEFRAGAHGAVGLGTRLAQLLRSNTDFQVIDPQEARRRTGARIDAEVARCAGNTHCTALLGAALGADEVLLVGVSQLGDVVIAMQRINDRTRSEGARLAESLAPNAEPSDRDLLGWLQQLYPPEAFRRYGSIRIETDLSGATVSIDGIDQGKTPLAAAVAVRAPATHKVVLKRAGYTPFTARIDVLPDSTVAVHPTLVREQGPQPWYKRWYVWAIIGGATAAAGAGLAAYYGTRVDSTPTGFIMTPSR